MLDDDQQPHAHQNQYNAGIKQWPHSVAEHGCYGSDAKDWLQELHACRHAGIETAHMIRKGQISVNGATAFQTFAAPAA